MAGERSPAARAVRDHLEVLVEEALVEELLEVPPDRFDVGRTEGPVGRVHVDPVPDAGGQPGELVHIGVDGLTTKADELGDADLLLDLILAGDAQLLLHLDLDGESVGVPAGPPGHVGTIHGMEPAEEVLVHTGPHMMEPGHPVGRGRALVEDPRWRPFALLHRALEDAVRRPAGQFGLLKSNKVGIRGDRCEHGRSIVEARGARPLGVTQRLEAGSVPSVRRRRPPAADPRPPGSDVQSH